MCGIWGAYGQPNETILKPLSEAARSRGRDGGGSATYELFDGRLAVLGNWRATPTPEVEKGRSQPYGRIVHNGTISNDDELGRKPGEVDSEVLPRVLDLSSAQALRGSLGKVVGSYAIAAASEDTVLLACNYKPIHYWSDGTTVYFSSLADHFRGLLPWGQAPVRMRPYSVLDLRSAETWALPRKRPDPVLVIASAGLDSTTVAYHYKAQGRDVTLLHFQYGCLAQNRETQLVRRLAAHGGMGFKLMVMPNEPGASKLTDGSGGIAGGIAGAEFAHEWVPARNLVMLSLATAYAEANGFGTIALGNNLEEAGAYPDNEEQFTLDFDRVLDGAVQNGHEVRVEWPVGHLMKHEIVSLGLSLGVPYGLTWSCYRGGDRHCGLCGPCFMRKHAFERVGAKDPVFA